MKTTLTLILTAVLVGLFVTLAHAADVLYLWRDGKPLWEDTTNGTHRMAVSYNPGLKRYLLTTTTIDRQGHLAIYDAPEPWGPWTTVLFQQDRERRGNKVVVFNFVNKWLSADGRRFVLVYTKNDHWASLEGEFLTAQPN